MKTSLTLPDATARQIERIVSPYRGTVTGYAAKLAEDFAALSDHDRAEMHALLEIKLKRLADREEPERRSGRDIGEVPAIPNR